MWWEEEGDNWSHEQGKEGEALRGQGNGNRIQEGTELVIVVVAIMMRIMFMFQPMPIYAHDDSDVSNVLHARKKTK